MSGIKFMAILIALFQFGTISLPGNQNQEAESYLGQMPPGTKAGLFVPDRISPAKKRHSKLSLSPDGKSLFWSYVELAENRRYIACVNLNDGLWGNETLAPFNSRIDSDSPSFWGNNRIVFHSKTDRIDDFWLVERKNGDWGRPKPLGLHKVTELMRMPMLTIADNGNIYFNGIYEKGAYKLGIYFTQLKNNRYTAPVLLPESINTKYLDWCPFISPDESYLIFTSGRHGKKNWSSDLYISFRDKNGRWLEPVNMGDDINTADEERFASITPDGKVMFFMRGGNEKAKYYWVDAGVINDLRPKQE